MKRKIVFLGILLSAGAFSAMADVIQIDSDKPVQIVDLHQGDDDHKEGQVTLKPTPGKQFKDFHFIENGKYGDVNYHLVTRTPTEVTVGWSVASHRVRGPFNVVVDTKTGYLGLSVQAQLEPIILPLAPVQQNPSVPPAKVGFWEALKIIYSEVKILAASCEALLRT